MVSTEQKDFIVDQLEAELTNNEHMEDLLSWSVLFLDTDTWRIKITERGVQNTFGLFQVLQRIMNECDEMNEEYEEPWDIQFANVIISIQDSNLVYTIS
jgi:hypothetical protein